MKTLVGTPPGAPSEQVSVHLDRGYDSDLTRERLKERGLVGVISEKGKPAPLAATKRWMVERTNAWKTPIRSLYGAPRGGEGS